MIPKLTPLWEPFEACAQKTLEKLERVAVPVRFPVGAAITTADEAAEGLTLFFEGVLRVFHAQSADCQFTVKLLRAPAAIGVLEVLRRTPWVACVEALTPVEGLFLPASAVREALAEDFGFTAAVLGDLATSFMGTIRANRAVAFDGCEQRLIRVLLEYAEHFGREAEEGLVIRYPLSRQRLSLEIGAARRSVDRALAALTAEKLLSLSPKGWQVLRAPDVLRARVRPRGGTRTCED